jgi:CBS domain-containing protein
MDYARATRIAARLGQGLALLFAVVGILYNPMLVLIALFVWTGAKQEAASVMLKRALSGVPVGRAMITAFRILGPSDRLSSAAELITAGFQHDFPVFDGSNLVGVLTRGDVIRSLSSDGAAATVGSAMHRRFETAHPADMLEGVLSRLRSTEGVPVVVVQNDAVVGLITAESLGEFIAVQRARRAGV